MKSPLVERLVTKLTSGRLLLTIMVGITWCYAVLSGKTTDKIHEIFMLILTFYFLKDKSINNNHSK